MPFFSQPFFAFRRCRRQQVRRQHGVILIVALMVMVILFIGAAAIVKSMNTSMVNAGNLAFRRDMVNQGELVLADLMNRMQPGGTLGDLGGSSNANLNYSAVMLPGNAEGIPEALLDDTKFAARGSTNNDITESTAGLDDAIKAGLRGTTIRYLIERLCEDAGSFSETESKNYCVRSSAAGGGENAGMLTGGPRLDVPTNIVYRVNIRVTGPRDTQVFIQASIIKPE